MRLQLDGLAKDIHITNVHLFPLETTQIEVVRRSRNMTPQATTNTTLDTIMTRLEELSQHLSEIHGDTDYGGDTEYDGQPRRHRYGPRRVVRNQNNFSSKIELTIPEFNATYNPDTYVEWELAVEQKFACHAFPANHQVRAATSEFTHFSSI
jgi:hypothetical protein